MRPHTDADTAEAAARAVGTAGLSALPPCPSGTVGELSSGARVVFEGAESDAPRVCLRRVNGHVFRYYLGFWGAGRFKQATPAERAALREVLTQPVGAEVAFALPPTGRWSMWKSVTVRHEANTTLAVKGAGQRLVLLVRVVWHGPPNRPDVRSEALWWIDRETGIPLKQEMVVRMRDGTQRNTVWELRSLDLPSPAAG